MTTHQQPLLPQLPPRPPARQEPERRDLAGLERLLRKSVAGEVRFDAGTRALYATDASNYRQVPIAVVVPHSIADVEATVAACRSAGVPLLSRGGGTSLAGQCCNTAVVLDWSKDMRRILEINADQKWARVQPGVVCDELSKAAQPYRLTWGPAPATHDHCCFGGMLGNNSCGIHAQYAGKAVDNTEELEVLLYDGTRLRAGWMGSLELDNLGRQGGRLGSLYAGLSRLRQRYAEAIQTNFPRLLRRVSGYNLDRLLPGPDGRFNLARALVGSESTLVTILEAKVRLVDNLPERVTLVLGYPDVFQAADHVSQVREYQPMGLEGMDHRLLENVRIKGGSHARYLDLLPEGRGFLFVEFGADVREQARSRALELMEALRRRPDAPSMKLLEDAVPQRHLWEVREAGLGATAFVPGQPDTGPGWEDSAVSPEKLGGYLRELRALFDKYHYHPALYGHFGQGCVHCRVDFQLTTREGIDTWKRFLDEASDLVVRYGGSLSGEHGDGQARAQYLPKMFGPEVVQAFREFKALFDPDGKMNPGKIVDAYRVDDNLRLGPGYTNRKPPTYFQFPEDGGSMGHAALRCVGVGACRRTAAAGEHQTMCPSYMVTREEKHSTRGRAHALWEMLHGDVLQDGWKDEHVKETLDLCLACKGCKTDCPVNVDLATYKAEFLAHYFEGRWRPRQAYAFGLVDQWVRVASAVPGLANLVTQVPGLSHLAKYALRIPPARQIPALAPQSFQAWFRQRPPRPEPDRPAVLLWPDTFNNHFFPETARAAVQVLEDAGYRVQVPEGHVCCGRPLYDYGFLALAQHYLRRSMAVVRPHLEQGTKVVMLEPSCCSVFRDELHSMFPEDPLAHHLRAQTVTLAEFLEDVAHYQPPKLHRKVTLHGHCHQKSVLPMDPERRVLAKMGVDTTELDSGCCGMAGAFGYERDKYAVSVACGERVLLPAVRDAPLSTVILSDGFSCREQIAQQTPRHALHLAEVLHLGLRQRLEPVPELLPERAVVGPRQRAVQRSMVRAGVLVVLGTLGLVAAARAWNRRWS